MTKQIPSSAALRLFNQKAEKLRGSTFAKKAFTEPSGVKMAGSEGKAVKVSRYGPTREEMDAAALTLRFFVQDNEPISLRKMAALYPNLGAPKLLVDNFLDCRMKINKFLDAPTLPAIQYNGKALSNRDVFETFFWGDMAHSNLKTLYDRWADNPIMLAVTENLFVTIMATFLEGLFYLVSVNNETLIALGEKPVPHAFPLKPPS